MIHHRPRRVQRNRIFRIEILEQRLAMSGMNLMATNNSSIPPDMAEQSHQHSRESAYLGNRFPERFTHHNGTNDPAPVNHPDNQPKHPSGRSDQPSTHSHHFSHARPTRSQTWRTETGIQHGELASSLSITWPALEGQSLLNETLLYRDFPENGLLVEASAFNVNSISDANPQPLKTPTGISIGEPKSLRDPVFSIASLTNSVLTQNASEQFPTSVPQSLNTSPTVANTAKTISAEIETTDGSSLIGLTTSDQLHRTSTTADTQTDLVRTRPAISTLQEASQNQLVPNDHMTPELPTESIQQQLDNLDGLLHTLAISREAPEPSSSVPGQAVSDGSVKTKSEKHNDNPTSIAKPTAILVSLVHSEHDHPTNTETSTAFAQSSAQWGIPLARHRAIASTILSGTDFQATNGHRTSTDSISVDSNPSGTRTTSDDKQAPNADTKQQSMSLTPPGTLGLAIACFVLTFPYIRRQHQRHQAVTSPTQGNG